MAETTIAYAFFLNMKLIIRTEAKQQELSQQYLQQNWGSMYQAHSQLHRKVIQPML
jgi:hypothetical protein